MGGMANRAEFARIIGKSAPYVSQLKSSGLLVMNGKLIDVDASLAMIESMRDPDRQYVAERHARERLEKIGNSKPKNDGGQDEINYQKGKATKAHYDGLKAKIEYETAIGSLLPVSDVVEAAAAAASILVGRLKNMSANLSGELSIESDEGKIKEIIDKYVDNMCLELHKKLKKLSEKRK
jgi:hypothetical protein